MQTVYFCLSVYICINVSVYFSKINIGNERLINFRNCLLSFVALNEV